MPIFDEFKSTANKIRRETGEASTPFGLSLDESFTPQKAPSESLMDNLGKVFSLDTSIGQKASGLGGAAIDAFGLPQEAATRILTGNEYALPGNVPSVRRAIQSATGLSPEVAALGANLVLDPLNLALGGGVAKEAMVGGIEAAKLGRAAHNLNDLRLLKGAELIFDRMEDAQKLLQKADVHLPLVRDVGTGLITYDLQDVADVAGTLDKLKDAKNTFNVSGFDIGDVDPFVRNAKPSDPNFGLSVRLWLGSPRKWSDASKSIVAMMDDAEKARFNFVQNFKEQVQTIVGGTQAYNKGNSPLGRAYVYELLGMDKFKATDLAAREARKEFGELKFLETSSALEERMTEALKRIPGSRIEINAKKVKLRDALKAVAANANDLDWDVPDVPTVLKALADPTNNLNPNNVDLTDLLNFFALDVSKRAFHGNVKHHINDLLSGKNAIAGMSDPEKHGLEALIKVWSGAPDPADIQLAKNVAFHADKLRALTWGEQLATKIKNGEEVIVDSKDIKSMFGTNLEKAILKGKEGHPFASDASTKARSWIYYGMLGMGIDSAIRNTSQLINTMTELGVVPTLRAMGGQFNKEWQEWLKASKVLDSTASQLAELFEHAQFNERSKFFDVIMSPMQAAENFNRGTTLLAAMNKFTREGLPLRQAVEKATELTRELQFGYGALDVSPYIRGPFTRPFFQFMSYPLKQMELIAGWAAKPDADLGRKIVRYALLVGAADRYSQHLGIDMTNVLIGGFMPTTSLLKDGHPQAVLYGTMGKGLELAQMTMTSLFGNEADERMKTPSYFWKGVAEVLKAGIPTGRYTSKVAEQLFETKAVDGLINAIFDTNFDSQRWMAESPNGRKLMQALNVNFDPGVKPFDRFVKLAGFTSVHEAKREKLMNFLKNFAMSYRTAISEMNEAAATGGNVERVRDHWIGKIDDAFGDKMEEFGVPKYVIWNSMKPADGKELQNLIEKNSMKNEDKLTQQLPKAIKRRIRLPEFPL